jgi:hypothetical protein
MPAHGYVLVDYDAAASTHLARERWVHRYYLPPSIRSFESKDGEKRRPSCVRNGLGQVVIPHQVGDPQLLVIQHSVLAQQCQRRLVVKGGPLATDRLVRFRQQYKRFPTASAPLLAFGATALTLRQILLCLAVTAWCEDA